MIRAVIFDFDGLIVDTETPALRSWQEIFEEYGQELTMDWWTQFVGRGESGDTTDHLEQLVGRPLDADDLRTRRRTRHIEMVQAQPILPGVEDRIAEAKALGLKLGVASSSPRLWVGGHLERLGLIHNFHTVRCRDDADVLVGKPDPAVYLAAMRDLDVAADGALALEDSPRGVQAARNAGAFTVAIPNGITRLMGDAGAHLTLDSMADMTLAEMSRIAEGRE